MAFGGVPESAAWAHQGARSGFEVAYFEGLAGGGYRIDGCTTAVEDGRTWVVEYDITVGPDWSTREGHVTSLSATGWRSVLLEVVGEGRWMVNGAAAPHLDGCFDVDLESSAMTNALPVHRMGLDVGARADAPAAYVHATDLSVDRLEQRYRRISDDGARQRYEYIAPAFEFESRLVYDESGFVLDYPGIAVRAH